VRDVAARRVEAQVAVDGTVISRTHL
jgi:hypothetical protein